MLIVKEVATIQKYLANGMAETNQRVGFVPTMGALHKGHLSLVQQAKANGEISVCSIFLNPTQFNNVDDFNKYPVTIDNDIRLLLEVGCDVLFLPSVREVYPNGPALMQEYDFGYFETVLEGAHRPGHFRGVGQVVARLLDIVKPDRLYLGQKDYQQCMVLLNLKEQLGLNRMSVQICETVREPDGLAMSSRNMRLTSAQRLVAGCIYQCLVSIQAKKGVSKFQKVQKECIDLLNDKGFDVEYVSLANANDLHLLDDYQGDLSMVALIAASIGGVRLIDNLLL